MFSGLFEGKRSIIKACLTILLHRVHSNVFSVNSSSEGLWRLAEEQKHKAVRGFGARQIPDMRKRGRYGIYSL